MKRLATALLASAFMMSGFGMVTSASASTKNWAVWAVEKNKKNKKKSTGTRVANANRGFGFFGLGRKKTSDRKIVRNTTGKKPGTIVIETSKHRLYYTLPGGKAISYGIGVGRPGFKWSGVHRISQKKEWPGWTPPAVMRKRQAGLPKFMPGGPKNPLGARALYLGSTLYRIHGTTQAWSIGKDVSSGCIRMHNNDVIDLYKKVSLGTTVYVKR